MAEREHSVVGEGLLTGIIGALLVATWYFVFDMAANRPFFTPNVLGKIFFRGDVNPGPREIVPKIVAAFTVVHLLLFSLAGMALTFITHLASRNPALRMGLWIGLVVSFLFFAGLTFMLATSTGNRLPLWEVLGGALIGVGAMAAFLLNRHPSLRHSLSNVPLGDEVESSAHSPAPQKPRR